MTNLLDYIMFDFGLGRKSKPY